LNAGVIDIVATDHAPHTEADKNCEFAQAAFGISGLETALGSLVGLILRSELTLNNLIASLTYGPAHVLGFEKLARWKWAPRRTSASSTCTGNGWWTRRNSLPGKNTPLAGQKLNGKVMATIAGAGRFTWTRR
jgi:dihydroorotase